MTDLTLVARKVSALRERTARAAERRPPTLDAFSSDQDAQDVVALCLFIAAQEAIDLAFHVATDEGLGLPVSNADAFELLAGRGVLPAELAARLVGVVAVRNRIAHGYATLDIERFWADLPSGLEALERFASQIAAFSARPR